MIGGIAGIGGVKGVGTLPPANSPAPSIATPKVVAPTKTPTPVVNKPTVDMSGIGSIPSTPVKPVANKPLDTTSGVVGSNIVGNPYGATNNIGTINGVAGTGTNVPKVSAPVNQNQTNQTQQKTQVGQSTTGNNNVPKNQNNTSTEANQGVNNTIVNQPQENPTQNGTSIAQPEEQLDFSKVNMINADALHQAGKITDNQYHTIVNGGLQQLQTLETKSGNDLADISDEDATFLMQADPNKYQEYIKAKQDKDNLTLVNGITTPDTTPTKETTPTDTVNKMLNQLGIPLTSPITSSLSADYQKQYDANIKPIADQLATANLEVKKFKTAYYNTLLDLRKQYEGTGASESFLRAMAAKSQEEQLPQYQAAVDNYNALSTQYTNMKADLDNQLKYEAQDQVTAQKQFETAYSIYSGKQAANTANINATKPSLIANPNGTGYASQVYNPQTQQWELQNIDMSGLSNTSNNQGSSTGNGGGQYIEVPRTGTNVGADTNNFGNITSATQGSIGMYKSPNGRSYAVYATAQDGYNALVNDIKAKQSGKTSTGLNANSTVADLLKTWVGKGVQQSYLNSAAKAAGVNLTDKIGNIDTNKLAIGIMAAEGTLSAYQSGGKDLSNLGTPTTQTNISIASLDPSLKSQFEKISGVATVKDLSQIAATTGKPISEVQSQYNSWLQNPNPGTQSLGEWGSTPTQKAITNQLGITLNPIDVTTYGLNPQYQGIAEKIASGQMAPGGLGASIPMKDRESITAAATAMNPNRSNDLNNFYKSWTVNSGPNTYKATNESMNNAIKHTALAIQKFNDLGNVGFSGANRIKNTIQSGLGVGNAVALKAFENEKNTAIMELSKAVKGGVITVEEMKTAMDGLNGINQNSSPADIQGRLQSSLDLMVERMGTIADTFNGKYGNYPKGILSTDTINRLKAIGYNGTIPQSLPDLQILNTQTSIQNNPYANMNSINPSYSR